MVELQARRVTVPFNALKPAKVPVWLIPTTAVQDDVALAVLVDIDAYIRQVLPGAGCNFLVKPDDLVDWREWAEKEFGIKSKGHLVTYEALSRFGWGVEPYGGGLASNGVDRRTGRNLASYWTVFFAQNPVRQLCVSLVGCEMSILHKDAQGQEMGDLAKWVRTFRKQVKSYKKVRPAKQISKFAKEESEAMWRRIGAALTMDENKRALAYALKHDRVVTINKERWERDNDEGDDEQAV